MIDARTMENIVPAFKGFLLGVIKKKKGGEGVNFNVITVK